MRKPIIIDRSYVLTNKEEIIRAIRNGSIFIYPTDTIYGLGCNATNDRAVSKIREIKHRDTKPFSVISPSKEWISEVCVVEEKDVNKYLPGPYTLFLKCRREIVSSEVNPNNNTLGVRIPDNWFTKIIEEAGVPFVTTSVNHSGEKHMEDLESAPQDILSQVDYIVYEGEKRGEPSKKINLVS